jgi:hypothetical protein
VTRTIRRAALVAITLTAPACSSRCGGSKDATPSAPSISPEPPAPQSTFDADDELSTRPVELLKFQWTSGIKNREPVDHLAVAHPGDRVYAHLTIRNRTGRTRSLHLAFSVNGKVRSELDLDVVESWSYRTWGYDTVLKTDKAGKLTLSVTDDEGQPIDDEELPIATR